ncbi:MAG: membrane protein insertase YidC [Bdellovibrionales bacterium]|nr:membrane protein insertase YidC [Bdellovibrionales bacterium]
MNENKPNFLDKQTLIALALIFMAWFLWERHMRAKYTPQLNQPSPTAEQQPVREETKKVDIKKVKENFFDFEDDVKKVTFSSKGMGIKELELKSYLNREKKQVLFESVSSLPFFEITKNNQPLFFNIKALGENQIQGIDTKGEVQVLIQIKDFSFSYTVNVKKTDSLTIQVVNKPVEGATGLVQSLIAGREPGLGLFVKTSKEDKRILFSKGRKEELDLSQLEVLGLGGRYFGHAFFNESDFLPRLEFRGDDDFWRSQIVFNFPQTGSEDLSLKYQTFFGPKSTDVLKTIDPQMISWVDFGFLSGLAKIILAFLKFAFLLTKNWGLSIILLTVFVRILLFPLNLSAYRSMKVMKKIQPEIQALRKKYKKDMKTMNEQMLVLMKKNKARPLGGCLPMLLQFPIFFALYRVLGESFELYQAPFFGWIQDLSLKDPFYVVPVLMGVSMYFQQKITPTNMDPAQEKVLRALPFIFTLFMINLPSGLNLYILVSTLFGLVQQYYFTKKD